MDPPKPKRRLRWRIGGLVVAMALLYVPMIGPLLWIDERHPLPDDVWHLTYRPVLRAAISGPEPIKGALRWYEGLWTQRHSRLIWEEGVEAQEDFMLSQETERLNAERKKQRSQ